MSKARMVMRGMVNSVFWFCLGVFSTVQAANTDTQMNTNTQVTKVRMVFGNNEAIVALEDNSASRDLVSLLPLTLTFEDYNSIEKISMLSRKLNTKDAPQSCDPDVGTFAYYAPWGNLSIFYRDFRHSPNLIPLGQFESGIEAMGKQDHDFEVRLELLK